MNKSKKDIAVLIYLFMTSFGMILGAFFIEVGHLLIIGFRIGIIIILTWICLAIVFSVRLIRDVVKYYIKEKRRSKR